MSEKTNELRDELKIFNELCEILIQLDVELRKRLVVGVAGLIGVNLTERKYSEEEYLLGSESVKERSDVHKGMGRFETFAELVSNANPESNVRRVLVAAYWCQICEGKEWFTGQDLNRELKNLGHGLKNITRPVLQLINKKPQLILQIRKTGANQQSRKQYKLSEAGIQEVEKMMNSNLAT